MVTVLAWIGALVVLGFLIRSVAKAIQVSGLKEFSFKLRFKENVKGTEEAHDITGVVPALKNSVGTRP
jgi:hypothetical protein